MAALTWSRSDVRSFPCNSFPAPVFCLDISASTAGVLGAKLAKMFISTAESYLDYLSRHLRERIAHAKRTGRSMLGQNHHFIPTEIEKITVSYCPGKKKEKKKQRRCPRRRGGGLMFINIILCLRSQYNNRNFTANLPTTILFRTAKC